MDFDSESFRNVNRARVRTEGVELQADWRPLEVLDLRAQATYTEIDTGAANTVLTGRPEWTASAVAHWRFASDWDTTVGYSYSGLQWAVSRHSGAAVARQLDDYHRLDWVLRWQYSAAWQLRLSVDNLLDDDYETAVGFPAPARAARIGVTFTH